jgi:hypothetical protein
VIFWNHHWVLISLFKDEISCLSNSRSLNCSSIFFWFLHFLFIVQELVVFWVQSNVVVLQFLDEIYSFSLMFFIEFKFDSIFNLLNLLHSSSISSIFIWSSSISFWISIISCAFCSVSRCNFSIWLSYLLWIGSWFWISNCDCFNCFWSFLFI